MKKLTLKILKKTFSLCRLPPDDPIPAWALSDRICSITRTGDELSVVCPEEHVPEDIDSEGGWKGLKVEGPLDFAETGIVAALSAILASVGIPIFVLSTFDTDYILIRDTDSEKAVRALTTAGHRVVGR